LFIKTEVSIKYQKIEKKHKQSNKQSNPVFWHLNLLAASSLPKVSVALPINFGG